MSKVTEEVVQKIVANLKDMQYGTLLITVHNDEIVQLDITKKHRYDRVAAKRVASWVK